MKRIKLCVLCLILIPALGISQTYSIPWALQQPAWVFPLWFEDGSGAKDTIYFCYESNTSISPILLGAIDQSVSPDTFNVTFAIGDYSDTIAEKVELNQLEEGALILCRHFTFPLTIRWDASLLSSDSLPFQDQDPAPRAQGLLWFDLPMQAPGCYFDVPIVISDTLYDTIFCFKPDSVTFVGFGAAPFSFYVEPWKGFWSTVQSRLPGSLVIYPNPVTETLNVCLPAPNGISHIAVHDIQGRVIYRSVFHSSKCVVPTEDMPTGTYFLTITNQHSILHKQFIKIGSP